MLSKLAEGLNKTLDTKVTKVDYEEEIVKIVSEYTADKVLVTLPLAVLQDKDVEFSPCLPEWKSKAMKSLGVGKIEKVPFI